MAEADNNTTCGYKRKRKKSFFQKQSKFCKQGRYGRGAQLSQDNYEYFLRILDVMRADDSNDRNLLSENVFEETTDKEVEFSYNQLSSRVIEDLLPHANPQNFIKFLNAFRENPRPILGDPCASHVLEKLLIVSMQRIGEATGNEEHLAEYKNFIISIAKFLVNNLEELVWDTYAVHVIETCLFTLNGTIYSKEKDTVTKILEEIPKEFSNLISDFTNRLLSWPQFSELSTKDITSVLIQSLLLSNSRNKKNTKKIIKKVLNENFIKDDDGLSPGLENCATIRVLETCIVTAGDKLMKLIFEKCFQTHLKQLCLNKISNFAVQKLLKNIKDKELLEEMFVEIGELVEDILQTGHTGVVLALAEGCVNVKAKQGEFIKVLSKALHCFETEDKNLQIVPLTATLLNFEHFVKQESPKFSLHGTLIIQQMLQFNKPIKIVNSLLNMKPEQLVKLLNDPRGSHITDVFCTSQFIGEKSREKLVRKLQGQYVELGKSKHGSRSLDCIWNVSGIKHRIMIMDELKVKQSDLTASQFGKGVAFRFQLDHYRHNKEMWIKSESNKTVKEKLFGDITGNKKIKAEIKKE